MAKRKPTIQEMESALGYHVDHSFYVPLIGHRFYSDLIPIPDNPYNRTEKEYLHIPGAQRFQLHRKEADLVLPTCDKTMTIAGERGTMVLRRSDYVGLYKFFLDIDYEFGLDMPFLLTESEAFDIITTAQLKNPGPVLQEPTDSRLQPARPGSTRRNRLTLLNLPRELRDKIYGLTLEGAQWVTKRHRTGEKEYSFCKSLGDLHGFYFPFGDKSALLRVNRKVRRETLPVAYRRTMFYLADIEDLTRFLIAVGNVGRENIESLDFSWESQIDLDYNWRKFPDSETNHLTLPATHVSTCVQLLKQCRRLKSLRLKFEKYLMTDVPFETFKNDAGILLLCSIGGLEQVTILSPEEEPLGGHFTAQWLGEQMSKKGITKN